MTFHISTFASDDEGSYKNHPHWSWEPLWAQSVYTYIVMFEASYPLIIGERWLRANSWPAAGLAPSSLLLSPMLRMCVFQLQPRAAAVCSPCDQQGAQSRRQGVTMGGCCTEGQMVHPTASTFPCVINDPISCQQARLFLDIFFLCLY